MLIVVRSLLQNCCRFAEKSFRVGTDQQPKLLFDIFGYAFVV